MCETLVQETVNMKSFAFLLVLVSLLTFVQEGLCAAFQIPKAKHPDHPGKCYYDFSPVVILRKGEKKRLSNQCVSVECKKDYTILGTGCGIAGGVVHCKVVKGDLSKPYPHCCDEYIC